MADEDVEVKDDALRHTREREGAERQHRAAIFEGRDQPGDGLARRGFMIGRAMATGVTSGKACEISKSMVVEAGDVGSAGPDRRYCAVPAAIARFTSSSSGCHGLAAETVSPADPGRTWA